MMCRQTSSLQFHLSDPVNRGGQSDAGCLLLLMGIIVPASVV